MEGKEPVRICAPTLFTREDLFLMYSVLAEHEYELSSKLHKIWNLYIYNPYEEELMHTRGLMAQIKAYMTKFKLID